MRSRSLSPQFRSLQVGKFKRKSLGGSATRRPVSTDNQGAYDQLLKTSFIMSSIRKSIKQNDLKYLIGEKREMLRTEPSGDREWAEKICHETLIDVRRRYDAVKRQRIVKLQQTEKLKERVKTYSFEQNQWKEKINNGKQHSKASETLMNDDKMEVQLKLTDKKVFEHMKARLKQEIQYCKAQIIIKKRKLGQSQLSLRNSFVQSQKLSIQKQNAGNLLAKVINKFEEQERERAEHLSNLRDMINERDLKEEKEQQRLEYEEQEAEKALLARNEEEVGWHLLLMTHTFLKKMLINKMNNEMRKFKTVEQCFRNIKSRTEIKDANELVEKFLSRDETYGELLSEVAKTKDRHTQLKREHEKLLMENTRLQQKSVQLINFEYGALFGKAKPQTGRDTCWEEDKTVHTLKTRIKEWLLRQMMKISRLDKRRYQYSHKFSQESVQVLFARYLNYLNDVSIREDFTLEYNEEEKHKDYGEVVMDNKSLVSTNIRTKLPGDLKNGSKLFGGDNQTGLGKQKEEEAEYQKLEQEAGVLEVQRQQIIQGNSKYMRDLRARFREFRQRKIT